MKTIGPAFILLLFVAACAESGTPPSAPLAPQSQIAQFIEPTEPPPDGSSQPELQESAIFRLRSDVGWAHGMAYAGVELDYFATNWIATAAVTSPKAGATGTWKDGSILPHFGHVLKYAPSVEMPACDGTITGTASGNVWNQAFVTSMTTPTKWGDKSATESAAFRCPAPSAPPGTGGSGSAGDDRVCYTLDIDYYLYDPNTGEVTYLYTETRQYCTQPGGYAT